MEKMQELLQIRQDQHEEIVKVVEAIVKVADEKVALIDQGLNLANREIEGGGRLGRQVRRMKLEVIFEQKEELMARQKRLGEERDVMEKTAKNVEKEIKELRAKMPEEDK